MLQSAYIRRDFIAIGHDNEDPEQDKRDRMCVTCAGSHCMDLSCADPSDLE